MSDQPKAPERCAVLIVGAGPAGSAAARVLARAGIDVLLIDQQPQGRDKICGDGLIPDAHAALARLGLLDAGDGAGPAGCPCRLHRSARWAHRCAGPSGRAAAA